MNKSQAKLMDGIKSEMQKLQEQNQLLRKALEQISQPFDLNESKSTSLFPIGKLVDEIKMRAEVAQQALNITPNHTA